MRGGKCALLPFPSQTDLILIMNESVVNMKGLSADELATSGVS